MEMEELELGEPGVDSKRGEAARPNDTHCSAAFEISKPPSKRCPSGDEPSPCPPPPSSQPSNLDNVATTTLHHRRHHYHYISQRQFAQSRRAAITTSLLHCTPRLSTSPPSYPLSQLHYLLSPPRCRTRGPSSDAFAQERISIESAKLQSHLR